MIAFVNPAITAYFVRNSVSMTATSDAN